MKAAVPMGKPTRIVGKGNSLPSLRYPVTKLLFDVTFARILLTLIIPLRSLVAWNLLCGRRALLIAKAVERAVFGAVGWLSAVPRSRGLRGMFGPIIDIRRWHIVAAGVVIYSAAAAMRRALADLKDEAVQQKRALRRRMADSKSYEEWIIWATKLDHLRDGADQDARWRQETRLYDRRLLQEKVAHLRRVRINGEGGVASQMFAVRADLLRNLGNITNSELHEHFPMAPAAIREYNEEVCVHLDQITCSPDLPLPDKAAFLKETRHAFGRTALVLSGGGPLGTFHLGVVKALLEHHTLPRVLVGSSVGAIVCATVATRTDAELAELLLNLPAFKLDFFSIATAAQSLSHLLFGGAAAHDSGQLALRLRQWLGEVTFVEAYSSTGRVLNVSVSAADTAEPPRLLNYLTAPHVLIWSAVAASSAMPGLYKAQEVKARNAAGELVGFAADSAADAAAAAAGEVRPGRLWRDGSLEDDLPMRGLSEMFSVNHFIMSQTNPHIVAMLHLKRRLGTAGQLGEAELKHRCRQLVELLPAWATPRCLKAFSQPWEGDVTILPPEALLQLRKCLAPPSHADLLAALRQGELSTWAKLSAIGANCGIETALDGCIQEVAARERQARHAGSPLKARIPSLQGGLQVLHSSAASICSGGGGDGVWDPAEGHLPLPEERAPTPPGGSCSPHALCASYECTDASANALAAFSPADTSAGRRVRWEEEISVVRCRRSLDVIAP